MVYSKTIWVAKIGNKEKEFPSKEEAEKAEQEYGEQKEKLRLASTFFKYFPMSHEKTNSFHVYCANCGILLYEFESEWDGHRNERGKMIKTNLVEHLFDGERCIKCHLQTISQFEKMIKFYEEKMNTKVILDLMSYRSFNGKNDKVVLEIYKIVEFWNKNAPRPE